ncbi:hypothetical protein [Nocardia salmonicida]|uniref:hypothetical protein n=1 Tax=Nocardia salmonicida TaxID=53431 RepID=UPI0033E3A2AF
MGTVLKMLLSERHLSSYSDFHAAYDHVAAQMDPPMRPGGAPSKAQYYNWLAGAVKGLPHSHHRRVLAQMFPGWSIPALFASADSSTESPATATNSSQVDGDLMSFLGAEMFCVGATLVVPTFELSTRSTEALNAAGILPQHVFDKQTSAFTGDHRIDVPTAMAENDVRGMLYVMSMLQQHTDITIEILSDSEVVAACDRPYISFGLSSNDCTHMYLEIVETPLFALRDSGDTDRPYREELVLTDGRVFTSDDACNFGIIARVRPYPLTHPDRFWIMCAGLGHRGTTGASWYLAKHWATLHQRAQGREFVAVISVRTYSDQAASLEHLLTA